LPPSFDVVGCAFEHGKAHLSDPSTRFWQALMADWGSNAVMQMN
jgi:hypothetical protein